MKSIIILDTGPLSNCVIPVVGSSDTSPGNTSQACCRWLTNCEQNGAMILVPAITYYEVLREIARRKADKQRRRLQDYSFQPNRFIPLTTEHLESAADLWAQARNSGTPAADDAALDADTILCAQVLSLNLAPEDYVVATTNTKHLRPFVQAEYWENIIP